MTLFSLCALIEGKRMVGSISGSLCFLAVSELPSIISTDVVKALILKEDAPKNLSLKTRTLQILCASSLAMGTTALAFKCYQNSPNWTEKALILGVYHVALRTFYQIGASSTPLEVLVEWL